METEDRYQSGFSVKGLYAVGLLIMLYLMYSPTFLTDYLMNDERAVVGEATPHTLVEALSSYFFLSGRGLLGLYMKWVYDFVGYDTSRIQFVRFINFVSISVIAILLMNFLGERMKSRQVAFFVVLFFLSQNSFQGLMGYSLQLISFSQPAIWLSLLAFYFYFYLFEKNHIPKYLQAGSVFIILMLAMQSAQTYAFFAVIPMSYLALADWKARKVKVIQFLIISITTFVLSSLIYKLGLNFLQARGGEGYIQGEQGFKYLYNQPLDVFLLAVNPLAYWSVFKMWAFPFPLQNIPPLRTLIERIMSLFIMLAWLGGIFTSLWVEIKSDIKDGKHEIFLKWLAIACCFGLAATLIVADSPVKIIDHRPHNLLVFSGLVIFTGAYSLEVLASRFIFLRSHGMKVFMGLVVLMTAFGAQAGVLRNIVNIHMKQLDFIRTELLAKDPESYRTVVVILPAQNQGCITEPCGPWFGAPLDSNWHLAWPGTYRYAFSTLGVNPAEKKIIFVNSSADIVSQDETILIDWNVYSITQQMYADYFRREGYLGSLENLIYSYRDIK